MINLVQAYRYSLEPLDDPRIFAWMDLPHLFISDFATLTPCSLFSHCSIVYLEDNDIFNLIIVLDLDGWIAGRTLIVWNVYCTKDGRTGASRSQELMKPSIPKPYLSLEP